MGWKQAYKIERQEIELDRLKDEIAELKERVPFVRVINVTHVKNRKVTTTIQGYGHHSEHKETEGDATIVLISVDGRAETRVLEGTWTMKDLEGSTL